jgi:hypothetical protein
MKGVALVRFFAVVLRSHVTLAAIAALVLGMAVWMARNDPQDISQLSTLGLFAQMFAAASGFREPAGRGRFDPVLIRGTSRWAVAAAHWAVSAAPGVMVWIAVSLIVLWIHPGEQPVGLTLQGFAAILYVSSAAWTVGLPFTRYVSGVLWMLALVVLSGMNTVPALREAFFAYPVGPASIVRQAGAALVCPMFLVASGRTPDDSSLILIFFSAAALTAAGGLFIVTLDVPLRDAS